ncbi:MAG: RpiB/LacA/LacB family sugar-phosphate isomerase, partial [Rhizomicrobium sp.]
MNARKPHPGECMIAIGSDHAAFEFKEAVKAWLAEKGYRVQDFGTCNAE